MTLVQNDLWGYVFRSSTDCKSSSLVEYFSKSKVCKSKVSIIPNEKIFRLKISEHNVLFVQIVETGSDCGSIEPAMFSGEKQIISIYVLDHSEIIKELSSID